MRFSHLLRRLRIETRLTVPLSWLALSLASIIFSTLPSPAQCGGVITLGYNLAPTNSIYVKVFLSPSNAVLAGAGWRLSDCTNCPYITNSGLSLKITNSGVRIQFNTNVPGWAPPADNYVTLTNGFNSIFARYLIPSTLGVSPSGLRISSGFVGGPFSPTNFSYAVTNSGEQGCALMFSVSNTANWLTLQTSAPGLGPGQSATVTATLNTNASFLAPGIYPDTLMFTTNLSGTTNVGLAVNIPLTLVVLAPPPVTLNAPQMLPDGQFAATLQGPTNRVYAIEYSSNLVNWMTNGLLLTNSTGARVFTNPPVTGSATGFYRAREQPF
jgi:hypothetical protein